MNLNPKGKTPYIALVSMLIIMTLVTFSSYWTLRDVRLQSNHVVEDTMPIYLSIDNLLTSLINQETGVRGYLLTTNPRFLEAYKVGKIQMETELSLITDNYPLENYPLVNEIFLHKALPQIDMINHYFLDQIKLIEEKQTQTALDLVDQGKDYMDQFRIIHEEMRSALAQTTAEEKQSVDIAVERAFLILSIGLVAFLAMGITIWLITRRNNQMANALRKSEETYRAVAEELETHNEEIIAQQEEQEKTLIKLFQREKELESISSYQEMLTGFTDLHLFLENTVPALTEALDQDAAAVMLRHEQEEQFDMVFSYGYPEGAAPVRERVPLVGPAHKLLKDKTSVISCRKVSELERGFHSAYDTAVDSYYPLFDPNRSELHIIGIVVTTSYQKTAVNENNTSFLTKGLMKQFSLALLAQLTNEERKQQSVSMEKLNEELLTEKEMLEKQRDFTRLILESSLEGMATCNRFGRIDYCNGRMAEWFDTAAIQGMSAAECFERLHPKLRTLGEDLLQGRITHFTEKFSFNIQGDTRSLELYATPFGVGSTSSSGFLFVLRDRTDEERINELKNEFVSIVSHELRTPLSSVLGFIELMINRKLSPEKQAKYLDTIYKEAKRLSNLINDFLDLQRMESGKQTYHFVPVDLASLVQSAAEQWQGKQSHSIRVQVNGDAPVFMKADEDRIKQVIDNLLSNAIKYSPDSNVVDVTVDTNSDLTTLIVRDYGLGIPEEAKAQMFTKFYRVDNSDRRQIGGTGLGLAIVKEIIDAHGGSISFDSVMGEGTTFRVALPAVSSPSVEGSIEGSIVIVEDDSNVSKLISETLGGLGHPVVTFKAAEPLLETIGKLTSNPPLLFIVDIALEGHLTGWDLLAGLNSHPLCRRTPVIVSTAMDAPNDYQESDIERYMKKPFTMERLYHISQELLAKHTSAYVFPTQNEEQIAASLEEKGLELVELKHYESWIEAEVKRQKEKS
ncbi:ATP-binding protein [Paenibacillus turpanensis]|uniref:ATP-binding protein n=1 Tax=Paenibacillus turpanensis TaxID=2689078 RepID=UPI00140E822D|nr:ATP-binding protein [Paenibacillus turpanensis]